MGASTRPMARHTFCTSILPAGTTAERSQIMGYNIFYIIGVVVVVALVLAWLF